MDRTAVSDFQACHIMYRLMIIPTGETAIDRQAERWNRCLNSDSHSNPNHLVLTECSPLRCSLLSNSVILLPSVGASTYFRRHNTRLLLPTLHEGGAFSREKKSMCGLFNKRPYIILHCMREKRTRGQCLPTVDCRIYSSS